MGFADAAAMAGAKALAEAGVDPARVGLLVDSSVSRAHLEPSAAVAVHHALGLPPMCMNFDVANACLGFLNGMQLAAMMIDAGRIEYALVVDGEGAREVHENTLERLARPDATRDDVLSQFATLTLGSGAAAMVLGRADEHPEGHRLVGSVLRAATEHHELCIGDLNGMSTDTKGLLDAGMAISDAMWTDARADVRLGGRWTATSPTRSRRCTRRRCAGRCGIDSDRVPRSFPLRGNMGPASIPFTLATQVDSLQTGDRVLLMGVGSGLNGCCTELVW